VLGIAAGTIVWSGSSPLASEHPRSQEELSLLPPRIVFVVRVTMIGTGL
jgi:hypothetical protein